MILLTMLIFQNYENNKSKTSMFKNVFIAMLIFGRRAILIVCVKPKLNKFLIRNQAFLSTVCLAIIFLISSLIFSSSFKNLISFSGLTRIPISFTFISLIIFKNYTGMFFLGLCVISTQYFICMVAKSLEK